MKSFPMNHSATKAKIMNRKDLLALKNVLLYLVALRSSVIALSISSNLSCIDGCVENILIMAGFFIMIWFMYAIFIKALLKASGFSVILTAYISAWRSNFLEIKRKIMINKQHQAILIKCTSTQLLL